MSGYMVRLYFYGVHQFYMVNSEDPDQACEEVLRYTAGEVAHALTPLSDETLAFYEVQPKAPWMCFTTQLNGEVHASAFRDNTDNNIRDVGRGELRLV